MERRKVLYIDDQGIEKKGFFLAFDMIGKYILVETLEGSIKFNNHENVKFDNSIEDKLCIPESNNLEYNLYDLKKNIEKVFVLKCLKEDSSSYILHKEVNDRCEEFSEKTEIFHGFVMYGKIGRYIKKFLPKVKAQRLITAVNSVKWIHGSAKWKYVGLAFK